MWIQNYTSARITSTYRNICWIGRPIGFYVYFLPLNIEKIIILFFHKKGLKLPLPTPNPCCYKCTCQNYEISNGHTMYLQDQQFQGSYSSWCRLLRDSFLVPRTALPVETRARFSRCEFCQQTGTNPAKKGQVV